MHRAREIKKMVNKMLSQGIEYSIIAKELSKKFNIDIESSLNIVEIYKSLL